MNVGKTLAQILGLVVCCSLVGGSAQAQISFDTVVVGNLGNPADSTGYGSVNYLYSIGKTEVTISQYAAFLNAVAKTDTYGLWNGSMQSDLHTAGISRSGVSGSYSYFVVNGGDRPMAYVSWFNAARFVNWLENNQPTGAQGPGTTETGAYTLNGALSGISISRNSGAVFGLPTENEWYKAAYYDPSAGLLGGGGYWLYPTRGNTQPNSRNGSATDPNSANYFYDDGLANGYNGGYAVNNSTTQPSGNVLTLTGAFTLAGSAYGTFDQGGNVWEWNEAVLGSARGIRGGSWSSDFSALTSGNRSSFAPGNVSSIVGFRIVEVPEPGALACLGLGFALLLWSRRRNA